MRGNRILPLTFNGRANLLAIVGRRGRLIRIWDVDAGQIIGRFRAAGRVHVLAFTIDGWRLAAGGDNFVQVWDLSQDGEVGRLWHGGRVTALAFSGDGSYLVTGGADSISRIWRFNRPLSTFEEQDPLGDARCAGRLGKIQADVSDELRSAGLITRAPCEARRRTRPASSPAGTAVAGHAAPARRVTQPGGGQLVHHPVADDHAASRGEGTTAGHQLWHAGGDGSPPQPWWKVVDRLVDRVDQPEPIGLEPPQDRRWHCCIGGDGVRAARLSV
jgi:hypothetical protein